MKSLFTAFSKKFVISKVYFDINSSLGNEYSSKSIEATGNKNARLEFPVDDSVSLENWSNAIKVLETIPYLGESPAIKDLKI